MGVSLLSNCTSGGCGAKIGPGELAGLLARFPVKNDPSLLAGFEGRDDAAVYQIDEERALVSTVDFFSPMVDDPFLFGKIAAANALSDIYAMGARPLYALNLVCFPEKLDREILARILLGGAEKVLEAGAVIAGGHSIFDHEPKYGLAVTGMVNPRRFFRNDGCRNGDALILTKPLGAGLVMAALRAGEADSAQVKAAADSMERLNRYAAEKFDACRHIHACTDVTGFGLAVHAAEMAGDSHSIVIDCDSLPLLPGALDFAERYFSTAAGQRNRNFMEGKIDMAGIAPAMREIMFDPQTSGGLLVSVAPDAAQALCDAIRKDDPAAAITGEVIAREDCAVIAV
ncbi:MAG: selenide, water dikinase SelD [Treponema sp.]|jgi:selenide,water dikinase|nr:selenide, water dikinase SelD [Treponema sp.]